VLLIFLTSFAFAGNVNLPRTGQTISYATGDDGDIQTGVVWPDPRFTVIGDCVTDNLTGLMWAKNADLPNDRKTWYEALDYVTQLNNSGGLGGYTDWRLPNSNELESLLNASEPIPAEWLNTQGFINVQAEWAYWASTTFSYQTSDAWIFNTMSGAMDTFSKSDLFHVWPVRGGDDNSYTARVWKTGQTESYAIGDDGYYEKGASWPLPRFMDNGDGTVTDNLTGLIWLKDANPLGNKTTWQGALNYITGMNLNTYPNFNYSDWRLPNRNELRSLLDYSTIGHRYLNPALPSQHPFNNAQADYYWTSTTAIAYDTSSAWAIGMWHGCTFGSNKKDIIHYCWPVRGGLIPTLIDLSSFTAIPSDRKVILEWTTESEIDNAGFNLYRAESEDGEYVRINISLIPAEGSATQGVSYQFVDEGVKNRTTYYYKLEDIDLNGKSTMHGPASATPRAVYRTAR
jgi:hypothetical protein